MFMKISKLAEICKSKNPMRDEMHVSNVLSFFFCLSVYSRDRTNQVIQTPHLKTCRRHNRGNNRDIQGNLEI